MNGKGDKRRPQTVTEKELREQWDRVFGRKDRKGKSGK